MEKIFSFGTGNTIKLIGNMLFLCRILFFKWTEHFLVIFPQCVFLVLVFGLLVIVGNSRRFRALVVFYFFGVVTVV